MNIAGVALSNELCYAISLGGTLFVIAFIFFIRRFDNKPEEESETISGDHESLNGQPKSASDEAVKKGSRAKATAKNFKSAKKAANKINFQHKWLSTTLKGHGATVLDFDLSPNGKYLISCAEDRTCFMWSTKEFTAKEHKFIKGNVEYDHVSCIRFSPDSRAFIGALHNRNTIRVFKLNKKPDNSINIVEASDFPEKMPSSEIINVGIASNGRFILTCHADTTLKVWSLKGDALGTIDTRQMYNAQGAVSPCGRFVASCGFTSDVKVWEVVFDRGGNFREIRRAFELVGHNAGVLAFDFNSDSTRMATCSKDGTWRLWDTHIEYAMGQDPYLLKTWQYVGTNSPVRLALAPNALSVAISLGHRLLLLDTETGEGEEADVNCDEVTALHFDNRSRFLVLSGGNRLHVLHNVIGLRARQRQLKDLHRQAASQGAKQRYEEELKSIEESLKAVESGQ